MGNVGLVTFRNFAYIFHVRKNDEAVWRSFLADGFEEHDPDSHGRHGIATRNGFSNSVVHYDATIRSSYRKNDVVA